MQQNIVTPEIAFVTLSWYSVIRLSLVKFFPAALSLSSEAIKSINRIEKFLFLEEFGERLSGRNAMRGSNNGVENSTDVDNAKSASFVIARNVIYLSLNNGRLVKANVITSEVESIHKLSGSKILRPKVFNGNMYLLKNNAIIKTE